MGYVGQQKQVAKTTNTKHTDTNKERPGARIFLLKGKDGTGVKRKSLIFFFWRKSLIFFFFGVSRVWKKKTEKCMILDLRFF